MIHLQIVPRTDDDLQKLIRSAISDGKIKSFETSRVKGGLRINHKKHLGTISLMRSKGPLLATLSCKNRTKEWQLLEAFVGRLTYHFANNIRAINIQLDSQ